MNNLPAVTAEAGTIWQSSFPLIFTVNATDCVCCYKNAKVYMLIIVLGYRFNTSEQFVYTALAIQISLPAEVQHNTWRA